MTNNEGFDENVVNRVTVETLIRRLPVSERQVIIWRFGLDGKEPRTLKEIARHYGFSLERARQIVERALHRLREAV